MEIKYTKTAVITDDAGNPWPCEYLGKGHFSTCWKSTNTIGERVVFTLTNSEDYGKEILARTINASDLDKRKHLPVVKREGDLNDKTVYKMPLYSKLTAKHKMAWAQAKMLRTLFDQVRREFLNNCNHEYEHLYRYRSIEICQEFVNQLVPGQLADALQALLDTMCDYGSSMLFEFPTRNLCVDSEGRLILLDIIFDTEKVRRK